MDPRLVDRLEKWNEQIRDLETVERDFLLLDGSEKATYSELFLKAEGKSIAEKEAKAYADPVWKDFKLGLAEAKTRYNRAMRELRLKEKAYDAAHLSVKNEEKFIRGTT